MASTIASYVLRLDAAALNDFLRGAFAGIPADKLAVVTAVSPGTARLVQVPDASNLRPGGIVSGPTLMGLADVAAYAVVLAHIGPVPMAVTSTLSIQFLRGCTPGPITAEARLLRLGRRTAVIDVRIWTETEDRLVAQSTVNYALPK